MRNTFQNQTNANPNLIMVPLIPITYLSAQIHKNYTNILQILILSGHAVHNMQTPLQKSFANKKVNLIKPFLSHGQFEP